MRPIDADALIAEFPHDEDWDYPVNTNSYVVEAINSAPSIKTKQIKYYDEDEQVWKIGSVIVDGSDN